MEGFVKEITKTHDGMKKSLLSNFPHSFSSDQDSRLLMTENLMNKNESQDHSLDEKKDDFFIKNLRLKLKLNSLNIITGKIGCGKTSILDALFGEMLSFVNTASLKIDSKVEYVE